MFAFRRIMLFCSEKCLSKHKMTIFSKIWGPWPFCSPLATPMFGLPLTAVTKNQIKKDNSSVKFGTIRAKILSTPKNLLAGKPSGQKSFLNRGKHAKFLVTALDNLYKHLPIQTIYFFVQNLTTYFADTPERGVINTTKEVVTG